MAHFMHSVVASLSKPEYAERPLFKALDHAAAEPRWSTVSYRTYLEDVEHAAAYWLRVLGDENIERPAVVGLW